MDAKWKWLGMAAVLLMLAAGCAAGDTRFAQQPAGFWAGVWHGLICCVTFIVSLFNDQVRIYEVHNSGHGYDLGFLLGAICVFGGSWQSHCGWRRKSRREQEWEDIARRVESKLRTSIQSSLDECEKSDAEWDTIGRKIEEKIKRELRTWAEH